MLPSDRLCVICKRHERRPRQIICRGRRCREGLISRAGEYHAVALASLKALVTSESPDGLVKAVDAHCKLLMQPGETTAYLARTRRED